MVFTSFTFLIFAAIFFPIFFMTRGRLQTLVCVVASYVFYGWWDWRFMALLATSTTVDYTLGRCIAASTEPRRRQLWVTASVVMNLGFLGFFKYFNFFAGSFADVARSLGFTADWATLHIVLPVGISFYTFQSMSYTIDVYRRRIEPERNFLDLRRFHRAVSPTRRRADRARLVAAAADANSKRFNWANLFSGFDLIVLGFFKKLVVADNLAPFVAENFAFPEAHNSLSLLLGVIFFAFQIYCDFSGYSTSPSASRASWAIASAAISTGRIWRRASASSGRAGTSRCRRGCATTSTSRSAATAAARYSPTATSC